MQKRLIVIGGGAAGFFCAVNAAAMNKDLQVILVEKTARFLSKVRVSGGGRCNVTHACSSIAEMIKSYPRGANFLKRAYHEFFTNDTIRWFEDRGVKLKTEADGRMFPVTDASQTIIECLQREVDRYNVSLKLNFEVRELERVQAGWRLHGNQDIVLLADYVCVACGGFTKAQHFGWLKALGHQIEDPVPSLFTFNMPGNPINSLMGVSVENVLVKIPGTRFESSGPLLITHWGMSGPSILRLSAWAARELAARRYEFSILINWLGGDNEQLVRQRLQKCRFEFAAQKIVNRNPFHLPQRLWEHLAIASGITPDLRWADLPAKEQNRLIRNLAASEYAVKGKTTFKEEFVTAGGIQTSEVDPRTMMSRIIPDLYFAGEILDVDGITGGFNFQHAWTSGYLAARAIAGRA